MQNEASHLKPIVENVFGVPVHTLEDDLDRFFVPKFEGYLWEPKYELLEWESPNTAVLLLSRKDLYGDGDNREDD
jgi:hypothetical protein